MTLFSPGSPASTGCHLASSPDDSRVAVGRHVADLVGRERGVDGHRHSPGVHGAKVGKHVLNPVRHHQRDPLAGLQPEGSEPGRQLQCLLPGLPPGDRLPRAAVPVGVRGPVAEGVRRGEQLVAERPALSGLLQRRPLPQDLICHRAPPPDSPASSEWKYRRNACDHATGDAARRRCPDGACQPGWRGGWDRRARAAGRQPG